MRGLFTAGVIDVMMEEGISFDGLVGVSAGARFGCHYKILAPRRVVRFKLLLTQKPPHMGVRGLLTPGKLAGGGVS